MTNLEAALQRGRIRHGAAFTEANLADQFRTYFNGPRIEVVTRYPDGSEWVRRGVVGMSTGFAPVFLLISRRNALGSSDVLGAGDTVARVIPDRGRR